MNFQIAASIAALWPRFGEGKAVFAYPKEDAVSLFRRGEGGLRHTEVGLPGPTDVLAIQGIPFVQRGGELNKLLYATVRGCNCRLKAQHVNLSISGVEFDCVVNIANGLRYLKVINDSADKALPKIRELIDFSTRRAAVGESFHHSILVITNNTLVHERCETEGQGRVRAVLNQRGKVSPEGCKTVQDFLSARGSIASLPTVVKGVATGNHEAKSESVLYAALGTNLMTTLIALWSHRPAEVRLVYTPGDRVVAGHIAALNCHKKLLPATSVSFVPGTISGLEILEDVPPPGRPLEVNVNPGTKSQAAMLTLLALERGGKVCSIDTDRQEIIDLSNDRPLYGAAAPDPEHYMKLRGMRIRKPGILKSTLTSRQGVREQEGILAFLQWMRQVGADLSLFPARSITIPTGGAEVFRRSATPKEPSVIAVPGRRRIPLRIPGGGLWLEKLVGYQLAKIGADDVRVRVRTAWSEETERHLRTRYPDEDKRPHMTDFDVVARFKLRYFVIECKSGNLAAEALDDAVIQVSGVAPLFGRFAVPLIACLAQSGPPREHRGVTIFGHETLIERRALKEALNEAAGKRSTRRH